MGGQLSLTLTNSTFAKVSVSAGAGGMGGKGGFSNSVNGQGGAGGTGGTGGLTILTITQSTGSSISLQVGVGGTGGQGGHDGAFNGAWGHSGASGGSNCNIRQNHLNTTTENLIHFAGGGNVISIEDNDFVVNNGNAISVTGIVTGTAKNNTINVSNGNAVSISSTSKISLISNIINVHNGYIFQNLDGIPSVTASAYNNYFNSTSYFGSTTGTMYTTPTDGANIVGGSKIAGNFWTNSDGTGFSDINGMYNSDFFHIAYNGDLYPLIRTLSQPSQTPDITTAATDTYGIIQQYNLPAALTAITYTSAQTATLATGNSIYQITGTGAVASVTTNTDTIITNAYLSTQTAVAINTNNTVIIYPYAGTTAIAIYHSLTYASSAVSQTSQTTAYTAGGQLIIHNTADGTYLGNIASTDTQLSANNNTIIGHSGGTTHSTSTAGPAPQSSKPPQPFPAQSPTSGKSPEPTTSSSPQLQKPTSTPSPPAEPQPSP